MAADITNQFNLSRGGRPVSGFFCSECARRAPPSEDPEGVRLLYVWWAGKPQEEGPMQVRLTGIDAEAVRMGPSDAGPREDPVAQDINLFNKAGADKGGVSKFRFRLNAAWSRGGFSGVITVAATVSVQNGSEAHEGDIFQ